MYGAIGDGELEFAAVDAARVALAVGARYTSRFGADPMLGRA